jgi:hypothetical protein
MSLIKQLRKYVFPRKGAWRAPRQFVDNYDLRNATKEQTTVILAGYARSPKEAQILMDKHGAEFARDLLPKLPPRRTRKNPLVQLANVIMRIEGARRGEPQIKVDHRLPINYRFKDES